MHPVLQKCMKKIRSHRHYGCAEGQIQRSARLLARNKLLKKKLSRWLWNITATPTGVHTVWGVASCEGLGWVDLDLGSSPGWWADIVATYCPSRMVEHPKSKSTQPSPSPDAPDCIFCLRDVIIEIHQTAYKILQFPELSSVGPPCTAISLRAGTPSRTTSCTARDRWRSGTAWCLILQRLSSWDLTKNNV